MTKIDQYLLNCIVMSLQNSTSTIFKKKKPTNWRESVRYLRIIIRVKLGNQIPR